MAIWRVVLCVLAMAGPTWAEDATLRWKFTPGDSQHYRMTQTARMNLKLGGETDVATEVHRVFDFLWSVESAEGSAALSVKVTRVRLSVTGPGEQLTEYDTQGDQQSRGFVATLAPLFKTLLESELKAQMNPQGELSRLRIPEDLQIMLSSKPAGKALGQLGSEDDFRSLFQLGLPALPKSESFPEGQQWEADRKLQSVSFGSPSAHTVYRWKSTRQDQGEQLAVIVPTTTIRLNATATDDGDDLISGQESDGEILFNLTTGRLQSSQIEMNLELNSADGGQRTSGTLQHTLTFEQLNE
jgi:hypothetical protein